MSIPSVIPRILQKGDGMLWVEDLREHTILFKNKVAFSSLFWYILSLNEYDKFYKYENINVYIYLRDLDL